MNEKSRGLNVLYGKGDIAERTIGHIGALPTHLILGTPGEMFKSPDEELTAYLQEKYQDVDWQGDVEVYVGHSPLFRQLKRLFQKERRTNLFARSTVGVATTVSGWLSGKFGRTDLYNPWAETAQVYHAHEAVGLHELGHAEDFDQSKHPTLRAFAYALPFIRSKLEWNASHNAMKHLETPEERNRMAKVLEPAFGTYAGFDALQLAASSPLYPVVAPIAKLAPLIGAVAGHIQSRTSGQNEEGRNIFFNPEPLDEQVNVGALRPAFAI